MFLGNILKDVKGTIGAVTGLLDTIITTDDERNKAKIALKQVDNQITSKFLELENKLIEQENKLIEKNKELLLADANSEDKLQRRTRPIISLGLFGLVMVKYTLDIFFVFGVVDKQIVFDQMFWVATFGMWGIHAGTRGVEKMLKNKKIKEQTINNSITQKYPNIRT